MEPAPLHPPRAPIEGDSHAGLLAPLVAFAGGLGYTVCYRQLEGVEGLCDRRGRQISVAGGWPRMDASLCSCTSWRTRAGP